MLNNFRLQMKHILNNYKMKNSIHCQTKENNSKYIQCIESEKYTQNSSLGKLNKNRLISIFLSHMLNNFSLQMKYMINSCSMKSSIHYQTKENNSKYMQCTVSQMRTQYSSLGKLNKNHQIEISLPHMLNSFSLQIMYK